ncbi:hypothetical protein VUN82_23485 [Micrococcaceae bacterium Sec5.1]
MADFVGRVWKKRPFDRYRFGQTDLLVDGREILPEEVMQGLHDIIHARAHIDVLDWANGGFIDTKVDARPALRVVSDALVLATQQLTLCVATLLQENGKPSIARALVENIPSIERIGVSPRPGTWWPVNLLLIQGSAAVQIHRAAANFDAVCRGERPAGRAYNNGELMELCFTNYRSRSIRTAEAAFHREFEKVGRPLTQDNLDGSETPPLVTSEMAAVLASWLPLGSPIHAAAAAVSDALRGSYWLWLEDDMRAMATLRVVLEQTARMRVWRLKPQQAVGLEENSTPTRWLERAGWRRLASLNRVLGEMSHLRIGVGWGEAFNLLVLLNPDASPEEAPYTARRHALEAVTRLVMKELREQVRDLGSGVGSAFDAIAEEIFAGGPAVDKQLDDYLNHVQTFRSYTFPMGS